MVNSLFLQSEQLRPNSSFNNLHASIHVAKTLSLTTYIRKYETAILVARAIKHARTGEFYFIITAQGSREIAGRMHMISAFAARNQY